MKKAFITGVSGMDGSHLSDMLLEKGYEVHGMVRRSSTFNRGRIDHIKNKDFHLYYGDMEDTSSLCHLFKKIRPDEIYHLASMSHVQVSNDIPEYTFDTNAAGTARLLEAIRITDISPCVYNAGTSELFGGCVPGDMLNEQSMMHPRSPYAISKLYSYWLMRYYRDAYGLKTWNGILFNHEGPRRGENFVTRKVTLGVSDIYAGKRDKLVLGNLDALRDWGYAPDYVYAMWLMLQSDRPDDYVVATGETHSIRELIEKAFDYVGIEDWEQYVESDKQYIRPVDVDVLCGDSSKIKERLGWRPTIHFDELVEIMMDADLARYNIYV